MKAPHLMAIVLFIMLTFSVALAQPMDCFQYYEFQKGIVFNNLHPEKISYSPGDKLIAGYKLCSTMKAPIVEGKVRVQIFYNDPRESEQMIDEFFVSSNIALFQNDCLDQEFSWKVPAGAKEGNYTIKTYFSTADFFNLGGISFLAYGPPGVPAQMTHFNVNNPSTSRIYLSKLLTSMDGQPYVFGTYAPVRETNESVSIKTYLFNEGSAKQVSVEIKTYNWDDLTGKPLDQYTTTNTVSVGSGQNKEISYDLPALPTGAYLIKIIASSGDEKTEMKLRFAGPGEKARFEYAGMTTFPLKSSQPSALFFCVANSADYTSFFDGKITEKVVDSSGMVLFENSIDSLAITPDPDIGQVLDFTPPKDSAKLTLVLEAYGTNGTLMDSVEIPYDYSDFPNPQAALSLNLNSTQVKEGEKIGYEISYADSKGIGLDGNLLIYVMNSSGNVVRTLKDVEILGSTKGELDLAGEGNYTIAVRELRRDLKTEGNFIVTAGKNSTGTGYIMIALAALLVVAVVFAFFWKRRKAQNSLGAAGTTLAIIAASAVLLACTTPAQASALDFSSVFSNLNQLSASGFSSISTYGGNYNSLMPSNDSAHAEPNVTSTAANGASVGPGRIGVNFYSNPLTVDSSGDIIAISDQKCDNESAGVVGDNITGEWYKKGGPMDSPPVEWVDSLEDVKSQINAGTYHTTVYAATICSWRKHLEAQSGPSRCVVIGNLICSHNCTDSWSNSTSESILNVDCSIECIFFVDRVNKTYSGDVFGSSVVDCQTNQTYGIDSDLSQMAGLFGFSDAASSDVAKICSSAGSGRAQDIGGAVKLQDFYGMIPLAGEQIPNIKYSLVVNTSHSSTAVQGPKLEIKETFYDPNATPGETQTIRVVIKNIGDAAAKLDNLQFNIPVRVLYAPKTLDPGNESEILVEASVDNDTQLNLSMDYRAETTGCNPVTTYSYGGDFASINTNSVKCVSNAECSGRLLGTATAVCCGGFCRDSSKGSCQDVDGDGIAESWITR